MLGIKPPPSQPLTKVMTTSIISTVTQLFSTIVSIRFKNQRIPTTIFSSSVIEVTELKTITSTLGLEPSLQRPKRSDVEDSNLLDGSISEGESSSSITPTAPLTATYPEPDHQLIALLAEPEVQEAWDHFVRVLGKFHFYI